MKTNFKNPRTLVKWKILIFEFFFRHLVSTEKKRTEEFAAMGITGFFAVSRNKKKSHRPTSDFKLLSITTLKLALGAL